MEENYEVISGMYNKFMKDVLKQIHITMIKSLSPKKSPETYDRNWWWMVYGKIDKGLTTLRREKKKFKSTI